MKVGIDVPHADHNDMRYIKSITESILEIVKDILNTAKGDVAFVVDQLPQAWDEAERFETYAGGGRLLGEADHRAAGLSEVVERTSAELSALAERHATLTATALASEAALAARDAVLTERLEAQSAAWTQRGGELNGALAMCNLLIDYLVSERAEFLEERIKRDSIMDSVDRIGLLIQQLYCSWKLTTKI